MTYPFAQTVTLIHRTVTGQDADGNDVYTETETAATGVYAPAGSTELVGGRDTVTTQPTLYAVPVDTDLTAVDAVVVNGQQFEIDGEPEQYTSPFSGWQPGLVVRLRKVTG